MFGCLRRLGCLAVLLVVGVLLYLNQGLWLPKLRQLTGRAAPADEVAAPAGVWQPLTPEGAARARRDVQRLGGSSGPAFANVAPGDLAAYVYDELRRQLPPSAEQVEAAVFGDQLHVRTVIQLRDLGGSGTLGPLAQLLSDRDTVQFGGTLEVIRPGLAQFRVRQIKLRELAVPSALVPRILAQLNAKATRPEGVAADALPLTVPPQIGDVRIARGRVTLYRTAQ